MMSFIGLDGQAQAQWAGQVSNFWLLETTGLVGLVMVVVVVIGILDGLGMTSEAAASAEEVRIWDMCCMYLKWVKISTIKCIIVIITIFEYHLDFLQHWNDEYVHDETW